MTKKKLFDYRQMNKQTQIILRECYLKTIPVLSYLHQRISSYLHLGLSSPTWLWLLSDVITLLHLNECWKDAPTKTDCGTICFEAQMCTSPYEHGWWTSLMMPMHFLSWFDLTNWEESMEKNIKLTTMRLLASSWLIDHLDGYWHDAHNQSKDNSQKNPGEKNLHDESNNTTLGGRIKLDKQREQ